jgi:hypothetical protein
MNNNKYFISNLFFKYSHKEIDDLLMKYWGNPNYVKNLKQENLGNCILDFLSDKEYGEAVLQLELGMLNSYYWGKKIGETNMGMGEVFFKRNSDKLTGEKLLNKVIKYRKIEKEKLLKKIVINNKIFPKDLLKIIIDYS